MPASRVNLTQPWLGTTLTRSGSGVYFVFNYLYFLYMGQMCKSLHNVDQVLFLHHHVYILPISGRKHNSCCVVCMCKVILKSWSRNYFIIYFVLHLKEILTYEQFLNTSSIKNQVMSKSKQKPNSKHVSWKMI